MRRWINRTLSAAALGLTLAAAAPAQQPMPPAAEPVPPPVAPPQAPPGVPPPPAPAAPAVAVDPYQAATPYNPTVVGRPVPNPHYNRANFTLPCAYPNQNLAPLEPFDKQFGGKFLHYTGNTGRGCGNGCGNGGGLGLGLGGGCGNGCGAGGLSWLKRKSCCGDAGGSCATCQNTCDFVFGSSRTYFGESSREFFERPPSVDGIKHPYKAAKHGGIAIDP